MCISFYVNLHLFAESKSAFWLLLVLDYVEFDEMGQL
jgi:hypothetical protein